MISLAITTYNRFELTIKSCEQVLNDDRINDIVIVDDCSTDDSFKKLQEHYLGNNKVRVLRQFSNRGMSRNKADAIGLMKNQWGIILDSDNVITPSYLDALFAIPFFYTNVIYCPVQARPNFLFDQFEGLEFSKSNAKDYLQYPMFRVHLNTCNYFVNKERYLQVYEENKTVKEVDTIWQAFLWLKSGNSFKIVSGMKYDHLVGPQSGWLKNPDENMAKANEIEKLISEL